MASPMKEEAADAVGTNSPVISPQSKVRTEKSGGGKGELIVVGTCRLAFACDWEDMLGLGDFLSLSCSCFVVSTESAILRCLKSGVTTVSLSIPLRSAS